VIGADEPVAEADFLPGDEDGSNLTGLYYNGFRYYDSEDGRYLTPDPVDPSALNAVRRFVRENPGMPFYLPDAGLQASRHYLGLPIRPIGYEYVGGIGYWRISPADLVALVERALLVNPNGYAYVDNNPMVWVDPWGLWYFDLNGSVGSGLGITFGVTYGSQGWHLYGGIGYVMAPGGTFTYTDLNITRGWNFGVQGGFGLGGQIGQCFEYDGGNIKGKGEPFWEFGVTTPGITIAPYYVGTPGELWNWVKGLIR
jgi:hypothetical protein